MILTFKETANRHQCGYEISVNDLLMPCSFSSSQVVSIPEGLRFTAGKFEIDENNPAAVITICKNHEKRLRAAFEDFQKNTSSKQPSA